MHRDKQLKKLVEAWDAIDAKESLVSRTPIEGAIAVESQTNPLNIDRLKDIISIVDGDTDVTIKIGWKAFATLEEEDGRWYPWIGGKELITLNGFDTKQQALDKIIDYFAKE